MPFNSLILVVIAAVGYAVFVPPTVVQAQVALFHWSGKVPDVGTYSTVEDCLVVLQIPATLAARQQPRVDTAPLSRTRLADTLSSDVSNVARQCSAGVQFDQLFARETLYVREMEDAVKLLLHAGRTADARAFAGRWVAAVPASDDSMRVFVHSLLATRFAGARPADLAAAWAHAKETDPVKYPEFGFNALGAIWQKAKSVGDTFMTARSAQAMREATTRLPQSVTQSAWWENPFGGGMGKFVLRVLEDQQRLERADSLGASTQAYRRYQTALRATARLTPFEEPQRARPIAGESWFPHKPVGPRPTPGVVSIVLTVLDNECRRCLGPVALVRRLHARFPEVEFTMLANTRGYHGLVIEPPSPEQEAALIDSIYRKVHGLPATTVVHHTRFWRLPDPDRRRVNTPSPNEDMYPLGWMLLIDKAGAIAGRIKWEPEGEEEIGSLIEAMLQQTG